MRVSPAPLLLLALVVAACGGPREESASARVADSAATDSARRAAATATLAPHRADSVGAVGVAGTSAASGPAREALCSGVATIAGSALEIAFTRDTGSTFPAPREGGRWSGCLLRGSGTVRPFGSPTLMPDRKLLATMVRDGWTEDVAYQADGPEGNAFAVRRGEALCHYDILFPDTPGDDDGAMDSSVAGDSNAAAPLRFLVEVLCTPNAPPRGA